jgi:hypothetical protein
MKAKIWITVTDEELHEIFDCMQYEFHYLEDQVHILLNKGLEQFWKELETGNRPPIEILDEPMRKVKKMK